jgi:hypothetical protein
MDARSTKYSSTCFEHPLAHLRNVVAAVLLVVVGPAGRTDHDQQHCYHHVPTVKQKLLLQLKGS